MKSIITLIFLTLSISAFSQDAQKTPLPAKQQKEKLFELNSITDKMSFARKERYLDSLQNAGVIIRKIIKNEIRGCTLEDRESIYGRPQKEVIIFLEK